MDGRIFEERGKPESIFFFVIPDAAKPRSGIQLYRSWKSSKSWIPGSAAMKPRRSRN